MANIKKYFTEEERLAALRESKRKASKKYRKANPDKVKESKKRWYISNTEKVKENSKKWYEANKEQRTEYDKQWRENNPDYDKQRYEEYFSTPIGRAKCLANSYKTEDKKHNRGECTLTAKWIVDNIFSKHCHYCGETDWRKLGCDRIDNSLPHTPDNVVPCCKPCNIKRGTKPFEEFCKIMGVKPIVIKTETTYI